jgi:hypothetical protein
VLRDKGRTWQDDLPLGGCHTSAITASNVAAAAAVLRDKGRTWQDDLPLGGCDSRGVILQHLLAAAAAAPAESRVSAVRAAQMSHHILKQSQHMQLRVQAVHSLACEQHRGLPHCVELETCELSAVIAAAQCTANALPALLAVHVTAHGMTKIATAIRLLQTLRLLHVMVCRRRQQHIDPCCAQVPCATAMPLLLHMLMHWHPS